MLRRETREKEYKRERQKEVGFKIQYFASTSTTNARSL